MQEHFNRPPEGYAHVPFIYVFDGRGLTPGSSPENLIVRIQNEDFYLRSVAGMTTMAGLWRYYDEAQLRVVSDFFPTADRWTVVPQRRYPAWSQIKFDLQTVALAVNAEGNAVSYAGFQGVKQVPLSQFGWANYRSEYEYWEKMYTYRLPLNLNFFVGQASRELSVEVSDGDFELQSIAISRLDTPGALAADPFRITLYDPSGYNALSDLPCSPRWLNWQQGGLWASAFPCPPLVYPVQSSIKVNIDSLINAPGDEEYEIVFNGVERMPC